MNKPVILVLIMVISVSCIKMKNFYYGEKDTEKEPEENDNHPPSFTYSSYIYPFNEETQNVTAEITIKGNKAINAGSIIPEIPFLKYNKSWLLMMTADDCRQDTYCRIWAAINGKPVSNSDLYPTTPKPHDLYYDAAHLQAEDLPPNIIPAGKTLGYTDGVGNEVRFSINATLIPEAKWTNAKTTVNPGFSNNYFRFYMKSGLIWNNIKEMLNYGTGIAFHDLIASDTNDPSDLLKHFAIAQDSILSRLSGRGCKMLAEPNGNKTYVTAALQYPDIHTMVAQAGTVRLYPFKVSDDLKGKLLHRTFDTPKNFKNTIKLALQCPLLEREAIHIGVHQTNNEWVKFLQWVNDTYGKDGDNSVWFPSQEEYYEYNYYRTHATLQTQQVDQNTIKLTIHLPGDKYFYYPAVSVNLKGLDSENIVSVVSNQDIKGLSYGKYDQGTTLNIDCRKYLVEHATHFVEQYEKNSSNQSYKTDAIYFVNMLKDSPEKSALLNRIQ